MVAPLHVKPKQLVELVPVIQEMQILGIGVSPNEGTDDFDVLF